MQLITTEKKIKCPQRRTLIAAIMICLTDTEPRREKSDVKIEKPAGALVEKIGRFLLPKRVFESIVLQTLQTYRDEDYYPALQEGNTAKAHWIAIIMNLAVISGVIKYTISTPIWGLVSKFKIKK